MRDDWSSLAQIKYIPSSVIWNFSAIFNPPANNCERAFTQSYFLCGKLAIKGNQVWSCIDETRRAISIHRLSVPFFAKVHHHHLLCQQHWWCCYMFPFTMQSLYFQFLFGTVRLDFNLGWHFPICLTKYRLDFFSWVYTATSLKWRLTNCFCKMSIVKARHHLIYSQII